MESVRVSRLKEMFKKISNITFAMFVFRRNKVWFALSFTKGTVKTVELE